MIIKLKIVDGKLKCISNDTTNTYYLDWNEVELSYTLLYNDGYFTQQNLRSTIAIDPSFIESSAN
ncbi:hypothetical protein M0R36_10830 [bacterium]|nr:hypothetical protein [bacterium]